MSNSQMRHGAQEGDWIMWWHTLGGRRKVGQVIQKLDPVAKGPGDGAGCLVRELAEGELRGPPWHVYDFQIKKIGLTPLEILACG